MSTGVTHRKIGPDEASLRLDRWFRRHFPDMPHARIRKLLRSGQIRIDGRRARADQRLEAGQEIRIPPLAPAARAAPTGTARACTG